MGLADRLFPQRLGPPLIRTFFLERMLLDFLFTAFSFSSVVFLIHDDGRAY